MEAVAISEWRCVPNLVPRSFAPSDVVPDHEVYDANVRAYFDKMLPTQAGVAPT
jgi:hypothetical protein